MEMRVPVIYGGANTGAGFTVNLSTSGVLIESVSASIAPGAAVGLRFSCCLGSFESELCGKVARRTADGFAVHFDALDALQQRFVQDMLACSAPLRASATAELV